MMIINSTKLQGLLYLNNGRLERLSVKEAVVCMVMCDSDPMSIAHSFKRQLSFDCSFSVHFRHEVSIREIGEVIHKNGGTYVTFGSGSTTMSGNKSRSWAD